MPRKVVTVAMSQAAKSNNNDESNRAPSCWYRQRSVATCDNNSSGSNNNNEPNRPPGGNGGGNNNNGGGNNNNVGVASSIGTTATRPAVPSGQTQAQSAMNQYGSRANNPQTVSEILMAQQSLRDLALPLPRQFNL
jgi:hypothetical protein